MSHEELKHVRARVKKEVSNSASEAFLRDLKSRIDRVGEVRIPFIGPDPYAGLNDADPDIRNEVPMKVCEGFADAYFNAFGKRLDVTLVSNPPISWVSYDCRLSSRALTIGQRLRGLFSQSPYLD